MNKKERDKSMSPKVKDVVESYTDKDSYKFDPYGSWTGRSVYENDKPVQDADDL